MLNPLEDAIFGYRATAEFDPVTDNIRVWLWRWRVFIGKAGEHRVLHALLWAEERRR